MLIPNKFVQINFDRTNYCVKDRSTYYAMIEHDIRILSAEILRLSKLPYSSWRNMEKIKNLDDQIIYLEEVMAAFERDLKKAE